MYYELLKRYVQMFNFKLESLVTDIYDTSPEIRTLNIYAKIRNFKTIVNPLRWFLVSGGAFKERKYIEHFWEFLEMADFPFLVILNEEGFWFADLSRGYNTILRKFGFFHPSSKNKTADGILAYNYFIFDKIAFRLDETAYISDYTIDNLSHPLELVVSLNRLRISTCSGRFHIEFYVKIYPENFTFDGIFLTHRVYDGSDKLTLSFLKKISAVVEKMSKINKMSLEIEAFEGINHKSELLDLIEAKYISPMCNEVNYAYNTEYGNINTEARLKKIKQTLTDLEKLKV